MEQLAEQFKGLADPTRLRIMRLLQHGELCVCDLMAGLDLPQSTVSRHMSFLKKGGWVTGTRRGKWVYYQLGTPAPPLQAAALAALGKHLPNYPEAKKDAARLAEHLKTKTSDRCTA